MMAAAGNVSSSGDARVSSRSGQAGRASRCVRGYHHSVAPIRAPTELASGRNVMRSVRREGLRGTTTGSAGRSVRSPQSQRSACSWACVDWHKKARELLQLDLSPGVALHRVVFLGPLAERYSSYSSYSLLGGFLALHAQLRLAPYLGDFAASVARRQRPDRNPSIPAEAPRD